jgi:dipeptidase E
MRFAPRIDLHGTVYRHDSGLEGKAAMKLLLTSSGISNPTIHDVLVGLLGKPVAESSALFVPTAIYPFPGGTRNAFLAISGGAKDIVFARPEGDITMTLVMAEGAGLVDFAIIPHVEFDDHRDVANAEKWAARLPVPTYAIDDDTAIKVTDGRVEVVSEGRWKLFNA